MWTVKPPFSITSLCSRTIERTIGQAHGHTCEQRDVARAGDVAGRVEPVRPHEVRVVQAELLRARVHPRDEERQVAAGGGGCERIRRVVRALDQRPLEQVAHGDLLSRVERDPRPADARGPRRHRDDLIEVEVLQRDEHRHELRDARNRQPRVRSVGREHLAVRGVDDVERARVGLRDRGLCRAGESETGRDGDEEPAHRAERYLTRSFWPTWSAFELTPGLSCSSWATVVPSFAAIEPNVSPLRTV